MPASLSLSYTVRAVLAVGLALVSLACGAEAGWLQNTRLVRQIKREEVLETGSVRCCGVLRMQWRQMVNRRL